MEREESYVIKWKQCQFTYLDDMVMADGGCKAFVTQNKMWVG